MQQLNSFYCANSEFGDCFFVRLPLKIVDGSRDADGQRCKPVRGERRRGHDPRRHTGDGVREEGMAEAQDLCDGSEGRL